MKDKLLYIILVVAIGCTIQRSSLAIFSVLNWQVGKIIVVLISTLYFFQLCLDKSVSFNKCLNIYSIFLAIILIWAYVSGFNNISQISALLSGLLPIYPFYYLKIKNTIDDKTILYTLVFFLVISILSYFGWGSVVEEERGINVIANNIGYYFVPLFNIVYFTKKKIIKYTIVIIVVAFVMASAKRGALLCLLFESIVYFYWKYFQNKRGIIKKIIALIFAILAVSLIVKFAEGDFIYQRMDSMINSSDGSEAFSGRDEIYSIYLNDYLMSDTWELLFGNGFNATVDIYGLNAHNDWIEILVDYGFITAVVYLYFFITAISTARKVKDSSYRLAFFSIIGTLFLQSIFSMGFSSLIISVIASLMGYLLAVANSVGRIPKKVIEKNLCIVPND